MYFRSFSYNSILLAGESKTATAPAPPDRFVRDICFGGWLECPNGSVEANAEQKHRISTTSEPRNALPAIGVLLVLGVNAQKTTRPNRFIYGIFEEISSRIRLVPIVSSTR